MDSEAVHFLGQAQFQLSGNVLAKLSYTYRTADPSPTTVNAFELYLVSSTSVITSENQNRKCLKAKAIMLKLIKTMKYSTFLCKKGVN